MPDPSLVADLIEAVDIESATTFTWLGQRYELRSSPGRGDSDATAALTRALRDRLYADFYCTGGVAPSAEPPDARPGPWPSAGSLDFSEANTGGGSPQEGWIVVAFEGDSVVVERDQLQLWADRRELRSRGGGLAVGAAVAVVLPKESLGLPDGFYTAYGDSGPGEAPAGAGIDRFYWNVRAEGRVALVRAMTIALNAAAVPFRLKVLNDAATLRCDAAVLYVPTGFRRSVIDALEGHLSALLPALRGGTPVFTKRLAPGLAFAEDPPGEESFGTHRCALLGDALVACWEDGRTDPLDRMAAVRDRFGRAGLAPGLLHLNPGSDPRLDPSSLSP